MSDALTLLAKSRPDALGPYFQFLKACGSRLEPRTRALISVITKVHAQTERGLKQYVRRALRDGCTPEQILDALLMAFPTLGLSRIVWAVDVMRTMDPPVLVMPAEDGDGEIGDGDNGDAAVAAAEAAGPAWHALGLAADFIAGQTRRLEVDGRSLFVHRTASGEDDGFRVWDARCPHRGTDMPVQALAGTTLTCPAHAWCFDTRRGDCVALGDQPLKRWPHRVDDGELQARW